MGYQGGGAVCGGTNDSLRSGNFSRSMVQAPVRSGEYNSTPVLGGSMRIGNWLGGSVIWAWAATMTMAAGPGTAEHVTTVPLGGSMEGQSGDHHYYGVYVP